MKTNIAFFKEIMPPLPLFKTVTAKVGFFLITRQEKNLEVHQSQHKLQ